MLGAAYGDEPAHIASVPSAGRTPPMTPTSVTVLRLPRQAASGRCPATSTSSSPCPGASADTGCHSTSTACSWRSLAPWSCWSSITSSPAAAPCDEPTLAWSIAKWLPAPLVGIRSRVCWGLARPCCSWLPPLRPMPSTSHGGSRRSRLVPRGRLRQRDRPDGTRGCPALPRQGQLITNSVRGFHRHARCRLQNDACGHRGRQQELWSVTSIRSGFRGCFARLAPERADAGRMRSGGLPVAPSHVLLGISGRPVPPAHLHNARRELHTGTLRAQPNVEADSLEGDASADNLVRLFRRHARHRGSHDARPRGGWAGQPEVRDADVRLHAARTHTPGYASPLCRPECRSRPGAGLDPSRGKAA